MLSFQYTDLSGDGKLPLPIGQLSNNNSAGKYSLISDITLDQQGYLYVLDQYFR
jgi:hypothetical protein